MGYFDHEKNVQDYLKMVEGYDGTGLINVLKEFLTETATLLELGMGSGKDLDTLCRFCDVTGSDNSQIFIDLYKREHKNADVLLLDAVTIETDRKFDCIYSNKVLHHLTREDLRRSFLRQKEVIEDDGLLFHSFWYGENEETYHGLRFTYYTESELEKLVEKNFEILKMEKYAEMEENDSFYVLLKKK